MTRHDPDFLAEAARAGAPADECPADCDCISCDVWSPEALEELQDQAATMRMNAPYYRRMAAEKAEAAQEERKPISPDSLLGSVVLGMTAFMHGSLPPSPSSAARADEVAS